ncbi:hypothetical protein BH10PLA1_BH10PLA1_10540 [soil metagenome]
MGNPHSSTEKSVKLDYSRRPRPLFKRINWRHFAFITTGAVAFTLSAGPYTHVFGTRLLGYQYGVWVNNAATICPITVVSQNGNVLSLSDGRTIEMLDTSPANYAYELSSGSNLIYLDAATNRVYTRFRRDYCGFSNPSRCQLITIPLVRHELPSHGRQCIGVAKILSP